LINQFLSPYTNRRTDRWGGPLENRMRFLSEIYKGARKEVGRDFPLLIKMNAYDMMKNGLKEEEGAAMAVMMADMGFDAIEVSSGIAEDGVSTIRGGFPADILIDDYGLFKDRPVTRFIFRRFAKKLLNIKPFAEGYNLESAAKIKRAVGVPVFAVGGISSPKQMRMIIETGEADYVSLCRPLIIDPNFPNKIKKGSDKPTPCIRCNYCLYYLKSEELRCYNGQRIKTG
jgi:2,4-dienoyl-CoA reductase-like NADH-dependent reductase (Old Yellow Enzyme family)